MAYLDPLEAAMPELLDESALWLFADKVAKEVESWPNWKKEGWAVLDKKKAARIFSCDTQQTGEQNDRIPC